MHGYARSCTVIHGHARSCHGKSPVPGGGAKNPPGVNEGGANNPLDIGGGASIPPVPAFVFVLADTDPDPLPTRVDTALVDAPRPSSCYWH